VCCAPKSLGEKLVGAKRGGDMMRGGKQSKRDVCVYRQYKKKKKKKKKPSSSSWLKPVYIQHLLLRKKNVFQG
jgi:hypothetical protein